jgi:hypothetical protein
MENTENFFGSKNMKTEKNGTEKWQCFISGILKNPEK